MSPIELPQPITLYFAAKEGTGSTQSLDFFDEHATVWDNGEDLELKGHPQITEWMSGKVAGYKLNSEIVSIDQSDDQYVVGVVVSGDFPGSPYKFEYRFKLKADKIVELVIDPIGSLAE